jgi:hypothetical protein
MTAISPTPPSRNIPGSAAHTSSVFDVTRATKTQPTKKLESLRRTPPLDKMPAAAFTWQAFTSDIEGLRLKMKSVPQGYSSLVDDDRYTNMQAVRIPETGRPALTMQSQHACEHSRRSGLYIDDDTVTFNGRPIAGPSDPDFNAASVAAKVALSHFIPALRWGRTLGKAAGYGPNQTEI